LRRDHQTAGSISRNTADEQAQSAALVRSTSLSGDPEADAAERGDSERLFIILFSAAGNAMAAVSFPMGLIHPREISMKKFSYVLAALAVTALTVPSIASAEDAKPGMAKEGMHNEGMMHGEHTMVVHHHHHHHHHHYHHHTMKKEM
jgi:hypothetical protein